MHSNGLIILLFVVISLLIGSLIKIIMKRSPIPYTIMLLLVGIALGGANEAGLLNEYSNIGTMFYEISHIEPHLILFLFLPTLIFESAYTMESHLFFRTLPQIALLAIVGLIISMLLSALSIHYLLSWGLGVSLLFGALISATDPVAVVALLKEKSSRKRLETLIEGESLLNDGTAIVFFSLFYGFALGQTTEVSAFSLVVEFIWVVCAGLLTGLGIGWITLWIMGKILNQPLIEITLSIVAAYVSYFIAESLHVSGVVALVSLALMFSTIGKTRISPENSHFLHQFWEMMTYIANTLIFLIVGIIIISYATFDSLELWITLALLYILLTLIRAISVFSLMPILSRIGTGITKSKASVVVWGGLRGAVSLSLALSIAQDVNIQAELREQILFLTAGIVFLTMLINGSTMEWLLHLLKLDRLPSAKEASVLKAQSEIDKRMREYLRTLIHNPFFDKVQLTTLVNRVEEESFEKEFSEKLTNKEQEVAFMRRLLEIERSDYWRQYEEGYIGRQAAATLSRSVESALDNDPLIAPRVYLNASLSVPTPPKWIHSLPLMGSSMKEWLISRLSLNYDIARGFVEAQDEMLKHIDTLKPNEKSAKHARELIEQNRSKALAFTRVVCKEHPELITILQKNSAQRLLINHERSLVWEMEHDGVLEIAEAQHLIENVDEELLNMRKNS
ncbi:hypothetical protein GJV85_00420 [Sulfurimonas aquatica]|uniref:Cation/H+ exchanger transmembrane domain-containing protein n=1 Tax=Sulfurimonas aquatica TaxID=2672570 RepID=A0A975GBW0_9BACT|nr:sodium:proton antiporter [Sulfurimonas aquatica]QSZ40643.1 hypothetical protein GJV85_00420 [Sulfurimonas aquatica]